MSRKIAVPPMPKVDMPLSRFSTVPPAHKFEFIRSDPKQGLYTLYEIIPVEVGEAIYHGPRMWSVGKLSFTHAQGAAEYLVDRWTEGSSEDTIEPGEYTMNITAVEQRSGKIILRIAGGERIVINTPGL